MHKIIACFLCFFSVLISGQDHYHYTHCFFGKSEDTNICLFNMPKNATTFLRQTLFTGTWKNIPYAKVLASGCKHVKIACIRDPLYRPISCYHEVLKLRRSSRRKTRTMRFYQLKNDLCLSFKTFLDEITDNFFDTHINHQHLALKKCGIRLEDLDYIFLFENLFEDLKVYSRKHVINTQEKPLYTTPSEIKDCLKDYIDKHPEIRDKIRELWAEDFKLYEEAQRRRQQILRQRFNIT